MDREEKRRIVMEALQREKNEAKANIPKWLEEGKVAIYQSFSTSVTPKELEEIYTEWQKCVQKLVNNYFWEALDAALEIMKSLNNDSTIEEAIQIFEGQEHSGISASIVRDILLSFSSRGPEFYAASGYNQEKSSPCL